MPAADVRLLGLPSWLQTWGLGYVEVAGWQDRGVEFDHPPLVVVGHHTATSALAKGDLPSLRILRDGRPDLRGPLCQVGLGRSGLVYVISANKANHAGAGAWFGLPGGRDYDVRVSSRTVGIEAEHPGDNSPWPEAQLKAYDRLIACLLWGLRQDAEAYCGHREWALPTGRKPDPRGISLPGQRARVAALLAAGPYADLPNLTETEDDDMAAVLARGSGNEVYLTDLLTVKRHVRSGDAVRKLAADGHRQVVGPEYDAVLAPLTKGPDIT